MEAFGTRFGQHQPRIDSILKDMEVSRPTRAERAISEERAREEYLATLFLTNSDKKRYTRLSNDIVNDFTRGIDGYPRTLSDAYDYLVNNQREAQRG